MKDTNLVNALREHANWWENGDMMNPLGGLEKDLLAAADRLENQNAHIAALQQEIEKLRGQVSRWIPVTERLPELQSWGASIVVLGLIKSKNAPSLNKLHDLTLCVYCDNGIWSMPGRYVAITHWMPLPEPPKEER